MAAQLYDAATDDVDGLESSIADGDVDPLRAWLGEHIHRHGSRYETNELVRQATGEDFAADAFLAYVEEKYGELYDL